MKQMTWLLCSRAESYTVHSLYPFSGTGILMGRPWFKCGADRVGAFIVRHDVLVVGRSFAPAHHHSPTPPPLLYLSFFIFFGCLHSPLGNLNEKFHNSSTRNRRNDLFTPCVRCCCSFPLCFLLLLFSFDFIISKVTALGARTTTTFYLMSWFWLFDIQENKTKKRATTCAQEFAHRFRFFLPSFKCFCVWTVSEIYSR